MAEIRLFDIPGAYQDGYAFGTRQRQVREEEQRKSGLSRLASQAYSTAPDQRTSLLSQMASLSPEAAQEQEKQFASTDDRQKKELVSMARLLVAAPDGDKESIYQRMRPTLTQLGLSTVPESYGPEVADTAAKLVQAWGPAAQQETPSAIRELQMLQSNPQLMELDMKRRQAGFERPQFQVDAEGQGWWLQYGKPPVRANQPPPQGDPQAAAGGAGGSGAGAGAGGASDLSSPITMPSGDFQNVFASIAARNGSVVTSGVRPVMPGVGAGSGSQHPNGTAADFRTNGLSDEQVQGLMADLRGQGFEVIDERDNRNGRGPHIHAELPPGGRGAGARGGGGPVFAPPGGSREETFSQPQVVTNPATGLQELVQFGNRGGRRVVNDYTPPPTTRDAKPPTEGERNASGYYDRMASAERELAAVVNSGYSPGGARDFYTAGQGPFLNWMASPQGQMYRQQQEDWVRAKLRKESGAAIGEGEMDREIKVYFPQPGDSPEVLKKKEHSRRIAIEAMRKSGGRAITEDQGGPSAPQQPRAPLQRGSIKPGTVLDGYRYRGGDEGNPNSWEKV